MLAMVGWDEGGLELGDEGGRILALGYDEAL